MDECMIQLIKKMYDSTLEMTKKFETEDYLSDIKAMLSDIETQQSNVEVLLGSTPPGSKEEEFFKKTSAFFSEVSTMLRLHIGATNGIIGASRKYAKGIEETMKDV